MLSDVLSKLDGWKGLSQSDFEEVVATAISQLDSDGEFLKKHRNLTEKPVFAFPGHSIIQAIANGEIDPPDHTVRIAAYNGKHLHFSEHRIAMLASMLLGIHSPDDVML